MSNTVSFIEQDLISNDVCKKLVSLFKESPNVLPTTVDKYQGAWSELSFNPRDPILVEYLKELKRVMDSYILKYPYANEYAPFTIIDPIKIQHYTPGIGFDSWHTERFSAKEPYVSRHLVFMTYLNTVTDKGGTEFLHQNLTVSPQEGLTLIWPADWTFTHRGAVSPTQEKYIITGWYNFL